MRKTFSRYKQDRSGQFAVWFGLMALPLLATTSYVMDLQAAQIETGNVKAALDAATLATVQKNNLNDSEKRLYAKDIFYDNFNGRVKPTVDVTVTKNSVIMTAKAELPTTVMAALGKKAIKYSELSEAQQTSEDTICVMALSQNADKAVEFSDSIAFRATGCSVQSNSKSTSAIYAKSSDKPRANSFCAVGGSEGQTVPLSKSECSAVADPYAGLAPPPLGPCIKTKGGNSLPSLGGNGGGDTGSGQYNVVAVIAPTPTLSPGLENVTGLTDNILGPLTGSDVTIEPGTYCQGLTVDGENVTFQPGLYVFQGPLVFKNYAQATAENVTFSMNGENGHLVIESGASLTATAQKSGPYSGLVFHQDSTKTKANLLKGGNKDKNKSKISKASVIQGGGKLHVVGTVYLPDQHLEVSGSSEIGAQSPALSFIANTIKFSGKANAYVAADARAASLPPLLPRNENGARLVR